MVLGCGPVGDFRIILATFFQLHFLLLARMQILIPRTSMAAESVGGPRWPQRVAPCEGLVNSPSSEECIQIEPAVE